MMVFGHDDAPHGHAEVEFKDVLVHSRNMIWGEGRGFEIAQGRLGPGRLHHCMRLIGMAERGIELMALRGLERIVFGGPLAKQGSFQAQLAQARIEIEAARLLVLSAASSLDRDGFKAARGKVQYDVNIIF
jgi:acyl-CoA dehydrogenase